MNAVPVSHRDLLREEARAIAFLGTTMSDGSPQVTPIWFDTDGESFRVNTARGRIKERNMAERPRVALAIPDPGNSYRYLQIRGTVIEMKEQGAVDHIRKLSRKYRGTEDFPIPEGQARVVAVIRPDHVSVHP